MPPELPQSRASVCESIQTFLLCANLIWTTLCLGGFLPQTMVITSAATAALLVVHAVALWRNARPVHVAGLTFVPFLVYAAANVIWITPVRWLGWIDWFNWVQIIAVFWVVLNGVRARRCQAVVFGTLATLGVIAVWAAAYQRFVQPRWLMLGRTQAEQYFGRASGTFGIPNSLAALLLLLIPAVGALAIRRRATALSRVLFGWILLVLLFGLGLSISRGAWLALGVALAAWPVFAYRVAWWKRITTSVAIAAGAAVAGFVVYSASSLVRERFTALVRDAGERSRPILWRAAWDMFHRQPIVGTGGGSFNVCFEKYRPEGFLPVPLWAHNDYLNTLSDYGSVGFVLFFGAAAVVTVIAMRRVRSNAAMDIRRTSATLRRPDWLDDALVRQAIGIGLLAFSLQLFVDFHFKIPALAMTFACMAGLVVSRVWPCTEASIRPTARWMFSAVVALVGVTTWVGITPRYRGEALRYDARDAMNRMAASSLDDSVVRERLTTIRKQLDRAVELAPDNGQAWADRSYALAQWARLNPDGVLALGRQAEADAARAIGISPIVAEFWIRRGVALDVQNRWAEAGPMFAQAVVLSPNAVLPWYHYAYHMSLRPAGMDLGQAAVEFCLRLDPSNPESQRLRQRFATSHSGL